MSNSLLETAPDFDQPIAVLKHCHDRIRKQIATLQKLLVHLPEKGANIEAKQAANAVMNYFNKAAHNHHEDEERDLIPMLQATASGDDATLVPEILREHQDMDAAWRVLDRQLQEIAEGASAALAADDVNRFATIYAAHMEKEETHIAPMAKRLFSPAQMQQLGNAMRARRAIN